MRLYVCYGTFGPAERHACARAHRALAEAGWAPKVVKTYGCYGTDRFFKGRREVRRLTGNFKVPALVLDDGTVIDDSKNIAAWAAANPVSRRELPITG
jgi:glutathione S-transferase